MKLLTHLLRHWLARQPMNDLPGKEGSLLYDADPTPSSCAIGWHASQ
jgi:hypothetical protein